MAKTFWRILFAVSLMIIFYYLLWTTTYVPPRKPQSLNRTLGFDHIYVVNLLWRLDRRERMETLGNALDLDFEFFSGVSKYDYRALKNYNFSMSIDQKACFASHYEIYRSIIKSGYRNALILEDDVDIELNITSVMSEIHHVLPQYWDLLYIGHCSKDNSKPLDKESTSAFKLYHSVSPYCTHAYAVSSTGARKLAELIVHPHRPIDLELARWIRKKKLISYSVSPSAIIQWKSKYNPSDIPRSGRTIGYRLKNSTLKSLGYKKNIIIN
ncbi:1746_t:CDS:1 [Acaulospora morrowiae]|uniref:1746_t:CDS:1 n=1 Tax=Acaulospora morrowiae TaxID=94023 RepID=A0A9N8VNT3_9GLOM|nr:1746_t:CDS:1 [Acaulospora morrowiae]